MGVEKFPLRGDFNIRENRLSRVLRKIFPNFFGISLDLPSDNVTLARASVTLEPISKMDKLETREQIAGYLGVSRMQLYRWSRVNPLPVFFTGYGNWKRGQRPWTTQDADEWKEETRALLCKANPKWPYKM